MKIDYHDLSDNQFESLVIAICSYLFGLGVQGFSTGPDGGKDARFFGRAERFPSASAPWDGRVVVQAKHTELINRKFSETDFSGDTPSSVLSEELPRIRRLRAAGELDYYVLFSNRRLVGVAEEKIRKRIALAAGIEESSVWLLGEEALDQSDLGAGHPTSGRVFISSTSFHPSIREIWRALSRALPTGAGRFYPVRQLPRLPNNASAW